MGQGRLFAHYARLFARHGLHRRADPADQQRLRPARAATSTPATRCDGCSPGASCRSSTRTTRPPTDEIRFGDNDVLAAQVAIMLRADLLVLLTDHDGLYTADPHTPRRRPAGATSCATPRDLAALDVGDRPRARRRRHARQGGRGADGRGRRRAHRHRRRVAGGRARRRVRPARTWARTCRPGRPATAAFKLWLRYAKPVRGTLEVDAGAARALAERGAACCPSGSRRSTARSPPATPSRSCAPAVAARSPGGS